MYIILTYWMVILEECLDIVISPSWYWSLETDVLLSILFKCWDQSNVFDSNFFKSHMPSCWMSFHSSSWLTVTHWSYNSGKFMSMSSKVTSKVVSFNSTLESLTLGDSTYSKSSNSISNSSKINDLTNSASIGSNSIISQSKLSQICKLSCFLLVSNTKYQCIIAISINSLYSNDLLWK